MVARGRGRPASGSTDVLPTDAVLDAALDAFAERGFEGTSVREIARDLGVSHNLIPQRIGSKDDLWRAAVDRGFGSLATALATALAEVDDDADDLDRLRAMIVRFVEANAARPALLRIISREAVSPGWRFDHLWDGYIDPVRLFGEELLCLLYTSPSPRDGLLSRMPSSA